MPKRDPFEKLAQETSRAASAIKCSREDYIEGLTEIIEHLKIDRTAAEEEQAGQQEREDSE
jgi:hypothetical protein